MSRALEALVKLDRLPLARALGCTYVHTHSCGPDADGVAGGELLNEEGEFDGQQFQVSALSRHLPCPAAQRKACIGRGREPAASERAR